MLKKSIHTIINVHSNNIPKFELIWSIRSLGILRSVNYEPLATKVGIVGA